LQRPASRRTAFDEQKGKEPAKEGGEDEQKQEEKDEKDEKGEGDKDKDAAEKKDEGEEEEEDIGEEHGGHEKIGAVSVEEEETLNLSPTADVLPLCEDLNHDQVHMGESCWSTCDGQCPNDVLAQGEGLAFDFDEIGVGHPGCTSHFECVGNRDRTLCHAVQAVEVAGFTSPLTLIAAAHAPEVPSMMRQSPADSAGKEAAFHGVKCRFQPSRSRRRASGCDVAGRRSHLPLSRACEFL